MLTTDADENLAIPFRKALKRLYKCETMTFLIICFVMKNMVIFHRTILVILTCDEVLNCYFKVNFKKSHFYFNMGAVSLINKTEVLRT